MVELMVTIAIFAILVSIAAPSMDRLIRGAKLDAGAETFQSALAYARSEATKRSASVSILAKGGGANGAGGDFSKGWTIFTDDTGTAGDCTLQTAAGEVLLRQQDALPNSVNLFVAQSDTGTPPSLTCSPNATPPNACITYTADGHAELISGIGVQRVASFCLQDKNYPAMQRGMIINFLGTYFLAKVTN